MDFEIHYTPEQEEFRKEVQRWLAENVPPDLPPMIAPVEPNDEQYKFAREFRIKLGEKGWRAPVWPKEYGGGGLTIDQAMIIEEEMAKYPNIPQAYDIGLTLCAPALLIWGSDFIKETFLKPILLGTATTFQLYSEPDAGSDLASMQTRAIRDGDHYVVNGQKIWNGSNYPADFLYLLAVTNPDAPRHNNISAFMLPADTPGVQRVPIDMIAHHKNQFFLDNVRIPVENRIGPENEGWRVASATLEVEHGARGRVVGFGSIAQKLIDYCKQTTRNGKRISSEPHTQQALVDLFIKAEIGRLWGLRNYWMRGTGQPASYEGSQFSLYGKLFDVEAARTALQVLGPFALVNDPQWAPLIGEFEHHQRYSLAFPGGGTPEVQKLVMARRFGASKTKEKAAATF